MDEVALASIQHVLDERTGRVGRREIGRAHHPHGVLRRGLLDEAPDSRAGAVDDEIGGSVIGEDAVGHRLDLSTVCGVERLDDRGAPRRGDVSSKQ